MKRSTSAAIGSLFASLLAISGLGLAATAPSSAMAAAQTQAAGYSSSHSGSDGTKASLTGSKWSTRRTVPSAPTSVTATSNANASSVVSWKAPSSNGGSTITGYTATSSPGAFKCTTSGTTSCTVKSLTNGTAYTFTVTATNSVGTGPASTPSAPATPAFPVASVTVPGAPTGVTATSGADASSVVSWTPPASDGGAAINNYTVTSSPGAFTCATSATSCTVVGLTNGSAYTFTVTASNFIGTGSPSSASAPATPAAPVAPATVPGTPTGVTATSNADASSFVSWTAPTTDGGSAITGYTVTSAPGGITCVTVATSCTVTGLTNGTTYTFTVTATNVIGTSQPSAASGPATPVTPATAPSAPTAVTATSNANASSVVSWTAPASNGGWSITGYTVTSTPGGITCATGAITSCPVTGLTNGTAYTFTVTATNAIGTSLASSPSAPATPATAPNAPTGVSATSGANASSVVSWTAPSSNGGATITSYTATSSPSGITCSATSATSCTVVGLTNGTAYTFTVTATNAAGSSAASTPSAPATPTTVPGMPTAVSATSGANASSVVSWTAPSSNGGSAITSYTVASLPGGNTCTTTTATSCTVVGLTNGTAYTFTARATSAVGTGPASAASAPATPLAPPTVPGAPTGVSATSGANASSVVTWTAPLSNGGSVITGYTVTSLPGGYTCTTTPATSCTVVGLTNGTAYTFTVTATNAVGTSLASGTSAPATPSAPTTAATAPGAPTGVGATSYANSSSSVSWTAPASNGGAAITNYTVKASPYAPIRAGFYYPWFPETWGPIATPDTQYHPTAGFYNSDTTAVITRHIQEMTYAGLDAAIASWWGQGQHSESTRIPALLNNAANNSNGKSLKWAPYYEKESTGDPTVAQISSDLSYLKTNYASNPNYLKVSGKPVIFVYTDGLDACPMAQRWHDANTFGFYLVLKVFSGYTACATQPDGWHQYGPSTAVDSQGKYSYAISPGFWLYTEATPRLARLTDAQWTTSVTNMAASKAQFQLVTTFNEWGEGTAVEPATEWASASGYGTYIDILHQVLNSGGATPVDASTCTTSTTSCTVPGLTNGIGYTFTVTATNSVGSSVASAASTPATPATVPGSATGVTVTSSTATSSTVSWKAPASNGGAAITGYTVTSSPGGKTCTTSTTSCTVTGLTSGTTYSFSVTATNAAGTGPVSIP